MTTTTDRSRDAERALLGALLLDRDAIASVVERLAADAFAFPLHRRLYQAILSCWERRVPPDFVTVCAALDRDGDGDYDRADLVEMTMEAPYGVHAPHYADLVVQAARERAIEAAGTALVKGVHNGGADLDGEWRTLQAKLDAFGAVDGSGPVAYEDLICDWRNDVIAQWEGRRAKIETPTGFRGLDDCTGGGFRPGELVMLGARPGMGKTALALQLAHQAAQAGGKRVLIFSAEMSRESLLLRAASARAGLSYFVIDRKGTHKQHQNRFLDATGELEKLPVSIDDQSAIATGQMQIRIEKVQRSDPVGLVIFDYLELAGDVVKGDSEERRIGEIVRRLKHVAMTCRVPVLALSQLNRSVEHRAGFMPKLADFRYSGAIEANADIALLLYRHDYYVQQGQLEADPKEAGLAKVIVAKHRNGPTPTITMKFHAATMSFEEFR